MRWCADANMHLTAFQGLYNTTVDAWLLKISLGPNIGARIRQFVPWRDAGTMRYWSIACHAFKVYSKSLKLKSSYGLLSAQPCLLRACDSPSYAPGRKSETISMGSLLSHAKFLLAIKVARQQDISDSGVILDCAGAFCDVMRGHDVTGSSYKEGTRLRERAA
jgi:hypothetical protein